MMLTTTKLTTIILNNKDIKFLMTSLIGKLESIEVEIFGFII